MQEYIPRIKDYIDVIFKGRKWIVLITLVSMLAAFTASFTLPKIYKTRAVVYIRQPFVTTALRPESISIIETNQPQLSRFGTEVESVNYSMTAWEGIMKGQDVLKEVIDRLKLKKITIEKLEKKLKVEKQEDVKTYNYVNYAPIIKFSASITKDPVLAADIVNAWADIFVEKFNAFYYSQLQEMNEIALKQRRDSEARLRGVEAAYLRFKNSPYLAKGSTDAKIKEAIMEREFRDANAAYQVFRQKAEQSGITLEERAVKASLISKAVPPQESTMGQYLSWIIVSAGALGFLISVFFTIVLMPMPESRK